VGWGTRCLPHVVIHLQKMTARAEDQTNRQSAGQVNALRAVFLRLWVDVPGEREAGIQQGPVGVAFGALPINLESQ